MSDHRGARPAAAFQILSIVPCVLITFYLAFRPRTVPEFPRSPTPDGSVERPFRVILSGDQAPRPAAPPPTAWGTLRVLDEETGLSIRDARIDLLEETSGGSLTFSKTIPASTVPGEFRYSGPDGLILFSVTARGYVGSDLGEFVVEVPKGDSLKHDFRLERAGTLKVHVHCDDATTDTAHVRVLATTRPFVGGRTGSGKPAKDGVARWDELRVGTYGIEVSSGALFDSTTVENVEIRKGEVTEVTVELVRRGVHRESRRSEQTEWRKPEIVAARGTVRFHPAWGTRSSCVTFRGKGETEGTERRLSLQVDPPGQPVRFDTDGLPTGEYRVEVQPQWRTSIFVPPEGAAFDFEIPEPAVIRVRVVEDTTGRPVSNSRLSWLCSYPGLHEYSLEVEHPDPKTGEFEFQVPPGDLGFSVSSRGWISVDRGETTPIDARGRIRLLAGQRFETTVRLQPAGAIRVLLRSGGLPLTKGGVVPTLTFTEVPSGGHASTVTYRLDGGPALFRREDLPTLEYTLAIDDPLSSFHRFPPRAVRIEPGQTTTLALDLEPSD